MYHLDAFRFDPNGFGMPGDGGTGGDATRRDRLAGRYVVPSGEAQGGRAFRCRARGGGGVGRAGIGRVFEHEGGARRNRGIRRGGEYHSFTRMLVANDGAAGRFVYDRTCYA